MGLSWMEVVFKVDCWLQVVVFLVFEKPIPDYSFLMMLNLILGE